jgi:DNA-directed RNA polymerase specialized sigma24 family protein
MKPAELPDYAINLAEQEGIPQERARVAHEWHEAAQKAIRDLSRIRRQAVRDMYNQGFTFAEIAEVLGVSRARAHQLTKGGR